MTRPDAVHGDDGAELDAVRQPRLMYIAGPMTGIPEYNYPAFEQARMALEAWGVNVLCPTDSEAQRDPGVERFGMPYDWYLRKAIGMLIVCDAVAVLPGWGDSRGARLEVQIAHTLGMPVHDLAFWIGA